MKQNIKNYDNYSDYSQKNIQKLLYKSDLRFITHTLVLY